MKQSTLFLDTLKHRNSDRKIAGKHPLLRLAPEVSVRAAYFQGVVLAALCDDGEISPGEQEHLRNLGISLSLAEDEVEEYIETVRNIRSPKDITAFLTDFVQPLSDKTAAMLFLCEFIMISNAPGHDRKDLLPYVEAFAEELKLANTRRFFQAFCAFANAEGDTRAARADDVRKNCPGSFGPFLTYFIPEPEESGNDALLKEIDGLIKEYLEDSAESGFPEPAFRAAPARKAAYKVNESEDDGGSRVQQLRNVLSQFEKLHPEISRYQLMQMLLPIVKQKYATLKRAIDRAEGENDRSRCYVYMNQLPAVRKFLQYVCLMDLLTVCNEDFMMIRAVEPPGTITWTSVKEPEDVAKAEAKELYGLYVKELEERCKR